MRTSSPASVLCLLFVVFFNGWGAFAGWMNSWQSLVVLPERLTMGFGTLLIAHVCFNIPYVILSVVPKLRQMDQNLIDAAQDLGCTWMQAFWKVVIPEIKPGIVSGAADRPSPCLWTTSSSATSPPAPAPPPWP